MLYFQGGMARFMKSDHGSKNVAFDQAQVVMQLLETRCGVWELKVQDVPIWWFVRNRFYGQLVNYFNSKRGRKSFFTNESNSRTVSHLLSICFKGGVFGLRSLTGMIRMRRIKDSRAKGRIMFLSVPSAFRGVKGKGISDIYFDLIQKRISETSIVVERTTLSKWDLHSLLYRKDVVFFDWFMLLAILKLSLRLLKAPGIKGWGLLRAECQEIDFTGISSEQLLTMIESVIDGFSRKAIVQVEASRMLLQEINPEVIIEICSYDSAPRAMNLVARERGIPIIELQHGLISQDMCYNYFLPDDYRGEKPLPNKILVYGKAFEQSILGMGTAFSSENIDVVGFPRLSIFLKKLKREGPDSLRGKTRAHLGIAQDTFVLTVATQPTTSDCLSNFLKEGLKRLEGDDFSICIKLHPSEAETWKRSYSNIIQDPRVRILTDRDVDLYDLLVASDVHITVYSTVFLECFALGVPNIIIGCPGYSNVLQLVDQNEIIIVRNPSELVAQLTRLKEDAEYRGMIVKKGEEAPGRFFAGGNSPVDAIIEEIEQCGEA